MSHHCPVMLDSNKFKWGAMPFRFKHMWLRHEEFRIVVESEWNQSVAQGWPGFRIMQKLKQVKGKLIRWNKETFESTTEKKKELVDKIHMNCMYWKKGDSEEILLKEEIL